MKIDQGQWQNWAREIVGKAIKRGASEAECALSLAVAREVSIRDGEIEKSETAETRHVAIKAYKGKRSASISLSLSAADPIDDALERLLTMAEASPEDPYAGLAKPEEIADLAPRDFDLWDDQPLLEISALKARADAMAGAVRSDLVVDQSGAQHGHFRQIYAASNGLERDEWHSSASQGIVAIHEGKALVRDYAMDSATHLEDLENAEATGARASDRTWQARDAKRPHSGKFPVMFDERVSSSLISHLLSVMSAGALARRASWLIDYEEAVLPQGWCLRETPFRQRKLSSSLRDAEGFAKAEIALIKNGRPALWYSDLSSARQIGEPSTGHARGAGVGRSAGIAGARLEGEVMAREAMLKTLDNGLLVTGFIGATINPHTGDYSRGINGFWVENGEIAYPVNEATIAGNLKAMLPTMKHADDADEDKGMVVGSLLVEEMTIASS